MAISKIILNGVTQMDVTQTTVTSSTLSSGHTAIGNNGELINGSLVISGGSNPTLGTKTITNNGTYIASNDSLDGYSSVTVNITPTLQSKTNINPTASSQTITADNGYDGLSSIQINAISSTYVGSGIAQRTSADLTTSGATITVPTGYYASAASTSVTTMTLPTSTAASAVGTIKTTINRSTSDQYINIPIGYNTASGSYKISAIANGNVTAPSTISSTGATVTTGDNTITFTKTVSVTPNVTSAGYISTGTAGNSSISLTASITTKAATTFTPGTTNQTISSATYLTGTQTILGDADLVAANIKTGVNIFGVAGSYTNDANAVAADLNNNKTAYVNGVKITGTQVINKFYTGSTAPSSSLGSNGDIYLQE